MKYCGLVRPQDVDAAVSIGVDAVGLVFYPRSPRLLDVDAAAALRRRLPSWVTAVGLFVNEAPERIDDIAGRVGLDVIQLHGDETVAEARALHTRWWKALRVAPGDQTLLARLDEFAEAEFCLLDSFSAGYGGSGRTFDWSLAPSDGASRLIMSGGLDAANVGAAILGVRPFAVDTSSGIQSADPREKDVGRMELFMEAVRLADATPEPGK